MYCRLPLLILVASVASCESLPGRSEPIIDSKGVSMAAYQRDLVECRVLAEQVPVLERAATGAATGAVIGGTIGAIFGDSQTAKKGAGVGAVSGGTRGAGSALHEQEHVVRNCLRGRGYKVLN